MNVCDPDEFATAGASAPVLIADNPIGGNRAVVIIIIRVDVMCGRQAYRRIVWPCSSNTLDDADADDAGDHV